MNRAAFKQSIASLGLIAALTACGGGGGDASDPQSVSDKSFPLNASQAQLDINGTTEDYSVTGTCSGSAHRTTTPARAASFEGKAAYAVTETISLSLTNCMPSSITVSGTSYVDTSYAPLGVVDENGEYQVVTQPVPALPASVKVGDTGTYASLVIYADSSKLAVIGSTQLTYLVEADTKETAIVSLISKRYGVANQLESSTRQRMRLDVSGNVSAIDVIIDAGSTRFVLTKTH